jgi:hypothetical protein
MMAMKTSIVLASLVLALSGCAVVPYEPAPVVYAAPPPPAGVVVVRPVYRGYYRGGPYWHRGWR